MLLTRNSSSSLARIVHETVPEPLEDIHWQNLGEDISQVVRGGDMHRNAYVLVPEDLHPLLAGVDVLQLRYFDCTANLAVLLLV